MAAPDLSVYFAGGREIVLDTSSEETSFTIGKNSDGSFTIKMTLTIASATANKVVGNFEDLVIPEGHDGKPGDFTDLKNVLFLEEAYEPNEEGEDKVPATIVPDVANLALSVLPQAAGAGAPFKMLFDIRFSGGNKTDQGGIDSSKTNQGNINA